jgi:hypothetical protein
MAIDPDLLELMTEEVTIEPYAARTGRGIVSYGAGTAYQCRIVGKRRMVRDAEGAEIVSTRTIYLGSAPGVTVQDRLTLPNGDQPVILSVASTPDEDGTYYETIYT